MAWAIVTLSLWKTTKSQRCILWTAETGSASPMQTLRAMQRYTEGQHEELLLEEYVLGGRSARHSNSTWRQRRGSGGSRAQQLNNSISLHIHVERRRSRVELRTLDYEKPGSNPGCGVKTLGEFFLVYIAPVHSAE